MSDEFGGFTLIRLVSSEKIEAQRYCASWNLVPKLDVAYREPLLNFEDSLLYSLGDEEYGFPKKFKYLNLEYLRGYLTGNLAKFLDSKMKKSCKGPFEKESFSLDFHENLREKLRPADLVDSGFLRLLPLFSMKLACQQAYVKLLRGKCGQPNL